MRIFVLRYGFESFNSLNVINFPENSINSQKFLKFSRKFFLVWRVFEKSR